MGESWKTPATIAINLGIICAVMFATAAVPTGPFVAVVMAPGTDARGTVAAVARAGGALIAPGRVDWIVIAHSDDSGFASRLRGAGAWLVLNHKVLSGCVSAR